MDRLLGAGSLPESSARDEWGHFLTYKVSPGFAGIVDSNNFETAGDADEELIVAGSNSEDFVHDMCQTAAWKDVSGAYVKTSGIASTSSVGNYNRNIYKARFCCPSNVSGGATIPGSSMTIMAVDAKPAADAAGDGVYSIDLVDGIKLGVEPFGDLSGMLPIRPEIYVDRSLTAYSNTTTSPGRRIDFTYHEPESDPAKQGFGHIGAQAWGGYWPLSPTMDIDITKHEVKEADFNYQDVGDGNWKSPVQVSLEVHDPSKPYDPANPSASIVDTIEYVFQLPTQEHLPLAEQDGKVDVNIGIKDILGEPTNPKLFNEDFILSKGWYDRENGGVYPVSTPI